MLTESEQVANPKKRMIRMSSIDKNMLCATKFSISNDEPLPELPDDGVRIQVCFAGACSADVKKCRNKIRNQGIMDTSLFPGYEISGIVDEIGSNIKTDLIPGDRVILYPDEDIGFDGGYSEYVIVKNMENIIPIPNSLSLEVAALLPSGGLTAYSACRRANPYINQHIQEKGTCNILVIGAGGLGLWATIMATHLTSEPGTCSRNIRVIVADTNSENLLVAQDHGCYGIIHWPKEAYEEYIQQRTENACPNGVDVVIDFVSSPRSIKRALKILNKGGVLVVGGNSQHEVMFNLADLAINEQIVIGVRRGTREELKNLTGLIASDQISAPHFNTFPIADADEVFQGLSDSRIKGRAILEVSATSL